MIYFSLHPVLVKDSTNFTHLINRNKDFRFNYFFDYLVRINFFEKEEGESIFWKIPFRKLLLI